jgi:hypothetical protein
MRGWFLNRVQGYTWPMDTEETSLDLFVRDSNLIENTNKIASHLLNWFSGSRSNAKEAFEMNRSRILIIST